MLLKGHVKLQVPYRPSGEVRPAACSVTAMRRGIIVSIIGLALAFGAFYVFSWPTTLHGDRGDEVVFPDSPPNQLLHTGQVPFKVSGRREISIVTVKLNAPSPG